MDKKNVCAATYFTYNHIEKTIIGSALNFKKSGDSRTPQYEALMAAMERHPNYTLSPIAPTKEKQSYKGLTLPLMNDYLNLVYNGEMADVARSKFAEMKGKAEKKEMAFATIKSWYLDMFPGFNVEKAKREIKAKKLAKAKAPYKVIKVSVGVPSVNK